MPGCDRRGVDAQAAASSRVGTSASRSRRRWPVLYPPRDRRPRRATLDHRQDRPRAGAVDRRRVRPALVHARIRSRHALRRDARARGQLYVPTRTSKNYERLRSLVGRAGGDAHVGESTAKTAARHLPHGRGEPRDRALEVRARRVELRRGVRRQRPSPFDDPGRTSSSFGDEGRALTARSPRFSRPNRSCICRERDGVLVADAPHRVGRGRFRPHSEHHRTAGEPEHRAHPHPGGFPTRGLAARHAGRSSSASTATPACSASISRPARASGSTAARDEPMGTSPRLWASRSRAARSFVLDSANNRLQRSRPPASEGHRVIVGFQFDAPAYCCSRRVLWALIWLLARKSPERAGAASRGASRR